MRQCGCVPDGDERVEVGEAGCNRVQLRRELAVEHDGAGVGVVEQVAQFFLDVAVVDVDRHRAELERGDHPFQVLHPVVQVDRHVIACADAVCCKQIGQAGGAGVGLGEGEAALAADERFVIGDGVGDPFPQVGQVELHPSPRIPRGRNRTGAAAT